MNDKQHSPAPWNVGINDDNNLNIHALDGEHIDTVIRLIDDNKPCYDSTPNFNAALIAAAPDMLAVLKRLLLEIKAHPACKEIVIDEDCEDDNFGGDASLITSWAKTIEDVINKAEGLR